MNYIKNSPYRDTFGNRLGYIIWFIFLAFMTAVILAFPIKWLWNWVMVDLFDLTRISAVQAFGLMLLARLFLPYDGGIKRTVKQPPQEK